MTNIVMTIRNQTKLVQVSMTILAMSIWENYSDYSSPCLLSLTIFMASETPTIESREIIMKPKRCTFISFSLWKTSLPRRIFLRRLILSIEKTRMQVTRTVLKVQKARIATNDLPIGIKIRMSVDVTKKVYATILIICKILFCFFLR